MPPIQGPHSPPVLGGSVAEGATDWGNNAERSGSGTIDEIDLATAADARMAEITPYEFLELSGTLAEFGGLSARGTEEDGPVLDCGQDLAATVRGAYEGDVDFIHIRPGPQESMCAFLTLPAPCAAPSPDGIALDLVAYRIARPEAQTCDLLEGRFLTLAAVEASDQPAWTEPGSFTPIAVGNASDVLLYVAGVSGCGPGPLSYVVRLVPVRHEGRCVDLAIQGF